MSVKVDLQSFLEERHAMERYLVWLLMAAVGLGVGMTLWLQKRLILDPIDDLEEEARAISAGNFSLRKTSAKHNILLKDLSEAFDLMRRSIASQHKALDSEVGERIQTEWRMMQSHRVAMIGCWEWVSKSSMFWCSESLGPIMQLDSVRQVSFDQFISSVYPADKQRLREAFAALIDERQPMDIEFRMLGTGYNRHVHLIGELEENSGRCFGTCQDVSARKEIESSLQKLSSAITYSGSSVIITDIVGTIEYVNPKYTENTGFHLDDLIGQQPDILSRQWVSTERYDALWQCIMAGQHWRGELKSHKKNGDIFWSLVSISPIKNNFGELTHFVLVLEDVTELKDAHKRMEQLALYDELTGLANRRLFHTRLQQLVAGVGSGETELVGAVMLLDLDFFKTINDTRGHQVGDELLSNVAKRIRHAVQESDMPARLGGDEFGVILSPAEDQETVAKIAGRIQSVLARPFYLDGGELQITTSIGIALVPRDGNEADLLIKHADLAMYQAKSMGRNQFRFFTSSLHDKLQTYMRFTQEMPSALESGQFTLFYQPQVNLVDGKVIGAEALIRWRHPELGMVPPNEFIPVAEETGFIVKLGAWVIKTACSALYQLSREGLDDVHVAVNLSARQFREPQLIERIKAVVADADIPPERLEIEITESLLMHDVKSAQDTLQAFRDLGISIAIDDFGTGYSSFNYLKALPLDILKIDREFIKDIPDHEDDMEITAAIISMAHRMKLKVVAEGIETDVQHNFLSEQSCDIGQGYLYG
ncbi:MAG: EAL domain-containing protein, partial [Pontibacterium sp.]